MAQEASNRQKAKELGAQDAQALIATVPYLARLLSKQQIAEIQKVLDAAVLNPIYMEEYNKARKDSVISRAGDLVLRDRAKERKAYRILDKIVRVSESDQHIRVDHNKMLTADALVPRTNNPDEADYLVKVRGTLNSKGVWLRLTQPWVSLGEGQYRPDPKVWEFRFSLGYDGDTIPTDDAIIDRDELLHTTMLGAGYYRAVLTGSVQTKIDRTLSRLENERDNGWDLHTLLIKNHNSAAPGVAKVSDWLGGAELPKTTIWDRPHNLMMKARYANLAGDVITAQVFLVAAAHAVEYNAQLLADYTGRTIDGAASAVKILKVAKTAGQVAEVALVLTGIGAVGSKLLRAAGGKAMSTEARYEAAEQLARKYAKENGISQAELRSVRYVPQPKGTVLGNIKGGHSAGYGTGFETW